MFGSPYRYLKRERVLDIFLAICTILMLVVLDFPLPVTAQLINAIIFTITQIKGVQRMMV